MAKLTIFTPTYNRKNELLNLFESLQRQSNLNFEWLIVDDGSTDNTATIVKQFEKKAKFNIKYTYQQNSGKYVAHNRATELCNTEYFICIDSDDILENNAIAIINEYISKIKEELIGVVFPRKSIHYMPEIWNKIDKFIDIVDLKYIYKIKDETSILIKTRYLKKEKFPIIEKEKFMSEEILYQKLAKYGKFEFVNKPISIYEYKEDGLTKNLYKNWSKSFNSSILLFRYRYEFLVKYNTIIKVINRIKAIMNLNALCINNKKNIWNYTPSKVYSIILFIPSIIWKEMKYEKNK